MIYLQLFFSFLQIGMFSFGGGYAALPLIQEQVVTQHGWLSRSEFTDLITISQMTPGPIAVNSATFAGQPFAHNTYEYEYNQQIERLQHCSRAGIGPVNGLQVGDLHHEHAEERAQQESRVGTVVLKRVDELVRREDSCANQKDDTGQ